MSKNSKNARKLQKAREMKGQTGPAKTKKLNTKKNTWYARKDGKTNAPAPVAKEAEAE